MQHTPRREPPAAPRARATFFVCGRDDRRGENLTRFRFTAIVCRCRRVSHWPHGLRVVVGDDLAIAAPFSAPSLKAMRVWLEDLGASVPVGAGHGSSTRS